MSYPWAYSDPIDGAGMDDEDREFEDESLTLLCQHCGDEMEYVECDQCGGEGFFDWETLQFDDPLWYGPDDTEPCGQCDGKGGWFWCDNQECAGKKE